MGRRYCCKHLLKNFKPQFPGLLMFSLFWLACGAFNPFTFRKAMERLQKANPLVVVWFSKLGPQSVWSKHAFNPAIKSDVNKSNFVESFNSTLGLDRCQPVMTLLEGNISHLPRLLCPYLYFCDILTLTLLEYNRCEEAYHGLDGY